MPEGAPKLPIVVGALLVSAGQPLFAEDTWWHLAMGRAYLAQGPWLEVDPLLFTAQGPPAPASWLAALFLHVVESWAGFHALRLLHVTLVAGILYAAARALLRASGMFTWDERLHLKGFAPGYAMHPEGVALAVLAWHRLLIVLCCRV